MDDIDQKTLDHMCRLGKIDLSDEEKPKMLKSLEGILDYTHELDALILENAMPCRHVLKGIALPLREDEPKEPLTREAFLKNAPDQTGGMVRIPPTLTE